MGEVAKKRPDWIKVKSGGSEEFIETLSIVRRGGLHTVCEEALCPNIGECWKNKTATFLIMGDICTRNCGFCNIKTGCPTPLDEKEPENVAECVRALGLKYVVITCVTRDDLDDGGARHFAETINIIHNTCPDTKVEVLTSDFRGNMDSVQIVLDARPDVFGHNIEVTRRLHASVKKPPSGYETSLDVLKYVKENSPILTKTGLIVGVGESVDEIHETIDDIVQAGVDIMTIGQYLTPSTSHYPISRFVTPEEFEGFKKFGEDKGLKCVISGPMVRSSYKANAAYSICTMTSNSL